MVRVDAVSEDGRHLLVTVPGWDYNKQLQIRYDSVDNLNVRARIKPDSRWLAMVNLGVERSEDLIIRDWNIP